MLTRAQCEVSDSNTMTRDDLVVRVFKRGAKNFPPYWIYGLWLYSDESNNHSNYIKQVEDFKIRAPMSIRSKAVLFSGDLLTVDFVGLFPKCLLEPEFNEYGEISP